MQHFYLRHIFTAEALAAGGNFNLISADNFCVYNCRSVIICIDSVENRIIYYTLAKVAVNIGSANALVDSLIKTAVLNNNPVTVFNKKDSHTRILTKRNFFTSRNFIVFDNL